MRCGKMYIGIIKEFPSLLVTMMDDLGPQGEIIYELYVKDTINRKMVINRKHSTEAKNTAALLIQSHANVLTQFRWSESSHRTSVCCTNSLHTLTQVLLLHEMN